MPAFFVWLGSLVPPLTVAGWQAGSTNHCTHAPGAIDAPRNLNHGEITAGETGFSPAPKEQPPRKLSGQRTAGRYNSGKRIGILPGPTEGATGAQPGNLSGDQDRGGTELAAR
jgi:hypothetical protein